MTTRKKSSDVFAVGVDLGGTSLRVVALDVQGRRLQSFEGDSVSIAALPAELKKIFKTWKLKVPRLTVASRGIWTDAERAQLLKACRGLAEEVKIISDVEAAWLAAFGESHDAGILVISGTGSIAYARDHLKQHVRAGGFGPLIGDEGSGFWIGREWIRAGKLPPPRGAKAAEIAALVPTVLQQATRGDREARRIVRDAQKHLADLILEIDRTRPPRSMLFVSGAGSVLENESFRRGFIEHLRKNVGRPVVDIVARHDAATAAANLFLPPGKRV